jgi:arylsulfatase A-like enzyme
MSLSARFGLPLLAGLIALNSLLSAALVYQIQQRSWAVAAWNQRLAAWRAADAAAPQHLPPPELPRKPAASGGALTKETKENRPDIVLISMDGLRADRMGLYGHSPSASPVLDQLGPESLVFTAAHSQSNESLFSHAALLSGLAVREIARPDYRTYHLPERTLLLPEILGLYGYQTGAFVAGGHVKAVYGFNQGFSIYSDHSDFGSFFHTVPEALAWLETARSPTFTFLHGYDTHRPYLHDGPFFHPFDVKGGAQSHQIAQGAGVERVYQNVYYPDFPLEQFDHAASGEKVVDPDGYARLRAWAKDHPGIPLTQADRDDLYAHYDSGVLSADLHVGRFLESLRETGRWANTLVLITADHGEDMGEHGHYNHRSILADTTTHVPLILTGGRLPPHLRGERRDDLASALDVLPTLLALAAAEAPAGLQGRDLLSTAPAPDLLIQEGVLPMLAVRTATHRLLVSGLPVDSPLLSLALRASPLQAPTFQLFDLRTDPHEQHNILDADPTTATYLRDALLTWVESRPTGEAAAVPALDPAFQQLLRDRGYW